MKESTSARNQTKPRTVSTELAALAAGVSVATIRKWASRGKLTRYGTPGRAAYDLQELVGLAESRMAGAEPRLKLTGPGAASSQELAMPE